MKKSLFIAFGLIGFVSLAQEQHKFCGTTEAMNEVFKNNPEARARIEKSDKELAEADKKAFKIGYENFKNGYSINETQKNTTGNNSVQATIIKIPVVFHILHQDGSEKITPEQVKDAVAILNRDYAALNADSTDIISAFQSIFGKAEIEFYLATKDPLGNCTNGIVYYNNTLTDWTSGDNCPYTGTTAGKWNPTKYMNVYSVKSISSGAAGYTYRPGTWGSGNAHDAIVILHNYIGSIGTGNVNQSRALTHEVGHWFNLPHVWGSTNSPGVACGDEGVSDTPITMGWDYCPTPTGSQVCNTGAFENYQNYMDYSYCSMMFTDGQVTRMRTALGSTTSGRSTLSSSTNLNNTGVTSPIVCVPDAGFEVVADKVYLCAGSTTQFKDSTWNATVTGWSWDFPGGTPSTSTDSMPTIQYNTPGVYSVTYTATTSAGTDVVTKSNLIVVSSSTASIQNTLVESYESIIVPNADWTIDNTGGGPAWAQTTTAACTGTNSMMINNFTNSTNAVEILYTPTYNLSAMNAVSPGLVFTFKLSHQRKTTTASEKLQVFSSTNCGQSWNQRYSKTGSALANVTGANTSPFVPTLASQWRTETVAISSLLAQQNVWFKFVFTSDDSGESNNIYIDDINITNNGVGIEEQFESSLGYNVYPNPGNGEVHVAFELTEKHSVKLELVDVLGKTLEMVVNKDLLNGSYDYSFGSNNKLASGVYFSKLTIDGKTIIRKIIIE
ncbi:MAG: M43 family zinc metalloprotease [Bacteroidota bacterium]|nr:M43 family zinc metalloprotease [Bacteroidota bacterium]